MIYFTLQNIKSAMAAEKTKGFCHVCGVVKPARRLLSPHPVSRTRRNEAQLCSDGLARQLETVQRPAVLEELHRFESDFISKQSCCDSFKEKETLTDVKMDPYDLFFHRNRPRNHCRPSGPAGGQERGQFPSSGASRGRNHRRVVDRSWRRHVDAPAVLTAAAQGTALSQL